MITEDQQRQILADVVSSLFDYARANRYVASAWGKLSINQQQALAEISRQRIIRVSDLNRMLASELSLTSHVIDQLMQLGCVAKVTGIGDSREVWIGLTSKGAKLVWDIDLIGNYIATRYASGVPEEHQAAILHFWRLIADLFSVPASTLRPGEHPLRPEIRRVTRGMRITLANYEDSGYRIQDLQILSMLGNRPCTIEEFSVAFNISKSAAWRIILKLESRGDVGEVSASSSTNTSHQDSRTKKYQISEQGVSCLRNVRDRIVAKLAHAAHGSSEIFNQLSTNYTYHRLGIAALSGFILNDVSEDISIRHPNNWFERQLIDSSLAEQKASTENIESRGHNDQNFCIWVGATAVVAMRIRESEDRHALVALGIAPTLERRKAVLRAVQDAFKEWSSNLSKPLVAHAGIQPTAIKILKLHIL